MRGFSPQTQHQDAKIYSLQSKLKNTSERLKKKPNSSRKKLWFEFLANFPIKFTKQKPPINYIVDFYCSSKKLVIELDGNTHYKENEILYDNFRTKKLGELGIKIIRFSNLEVIENFEWVCEEITKTLN